MAALIGRDVASELPYVLRNIERMSSLFGATHVVLVENDSSDGTQEVFNRWAANYTAAAAVAGSASSARLVSFTTTAGKKDLRLLATARNKYLDLVANDPQYAGVEYVIAVDSDVSGCWRAGSWFVNALKPLNPCACAQQP